MRKPLYKCEGTIANVLNQNNEKLDCARNAYEMKDIAIKIVNDSQALSQNQKDLFKRDLDKAKNANHLISIIVTFMTGEKVL